MAKSFGAIRVRRRAAAAKAAARHHKQVKISADLKRPPTNVRPFSYLVFWGQED